MGNGTALSTERSGYPQLAVVTPPPSSGTIAHCPTQPCGYCCCDFNEGNYIVLYPGEVEEARRTGHRLEHLTIAPDGNGGHRAICHARDKHNCDQGYKPLDCQSYPLFPGSDRDSSELTIQLKGAKCPLLAAQLRDHTRWVKLQWQALIAKNVRITDWLRSVRLVGYEPFDDRDS